MLGWRPHLLSWINTLPETITEHQKRFIRQLFDRNIMPGLHFVRKGGFKVGFLSTRLRVKDVLCFDIQHSHQLQIGE